ncbi:MAG: outer membrane beta-barrel protein [Chitinophagaceae bacterium]|nr:outer membrane beta-barrel protein [Chitinophagaceae bacterium]
MSNSQQFDNYVKEQFNDYAPDVHPRIWENIAAHNERRKPVGFWYTLLNNKNKIFLAVLLLAISTGSGWWYFTKNSASPAIQQLSSEKNKPSIPQQTGLAKEEQSPDNSNTNSAIQKEPVTTFNTGLNTASGTNAGTDKIKNTNNHLSRKGASNIAIYSPSIQTEEENITTGNHSGSAKKQKGTGNLLRINSTAPGTGDEEEEYAAGGSLLGRLTFDAEMISARRKAKSPLSLSFQQIAFLPDCPSIEKNASGNKKYLEIYGGPDYAFRSFSDTANSEYLKRRKESTKFSSAFSAGVRYTKVFNNSMSVRAGVNYSQINEKFTFSQGNLVQVTYIIGTNGDTLGSYITTGTRYKTTINKYRSIDIPLAMGYEIGNGRLHANINAGVIVNIYSWQKGDVLDTAYNPVNITTGKGSSPYQFKSNIGVGFIGGVSVYYKLTDRLHLMAEPYFRYNFSPMNKDNITLKQKYQTAGLRVGIRIDLK